MATNIQKKLQLARLVQTHFDLAGFPNMFPKAQQLNRRFIAYLGPTNSGKTYEALQALKAAKHGCYLAPLRLLALENYDALKEAELDVSLITGDDKRISESATHVSATVEMADFSKEWEVAVVDEVHMLQDPQRGFAWTSAIVGLCAHTIYLIGPTYTEEALRALVKRAGGELEVIYTERKNALTVEDDAISPSDIKKGDAVIAFSRKDVLYWKDYLESQGHKVAAIYGNLSAEVRRAQAKAYREGDLDVLVGTDAFSMGLNMPIQRIVLTTNAKFDGVELGPVPTWLIQQIAGRAGRFGMAEEGKVTSLHTEVQAWLREELSTQVEPLNPTGFYVAPTLAQLEALQAAFTQAMPLSKLLLRFAEFATSTDRFFIPTDVQHQIGRAQWLDSHTTLTLEEKFLFSLTPISSSVDKLETELQRWVHFYKNQKTVTLNELRVPNAHAELLELEDYCKLCSGYLWLSYRLPLTFTDHDNVMASMIEVSQLIDDNLRRKNASRKPTLSKIVKNRRNKDTTKPRK